MQKTLLVITALSGILAVTLGAFGAHGLEQYFSTYPKGLHMWEKAVQYQVYHTLAIFMCYLFVRKENVNFIRNAGLCFALGILFFSGSLYLLATHPLTGIPTSVIGPITPIGGFFFIIGWGLVLVQALKNND
ncbi:MAG: DUF423 domain-containing protein [Bacteroidetes bacterium]|nr:DUF423 domain-containing protein [Bacteroidota bacterium]